MRHYQYINSSSSSLTLRHSRRYNYNTHDTGSVTAALHFCRSHLSCGHDNDAVTQYTAIPANKTLKLILTQQEYLLTKFSDVSPVTGRQNPTGKPRRYEHRRGADQLTHIYDKLLLSMATTVLTSSGETTVRT